MAINTADAQQITSQTTDWFRARVRQHYIELTDEDIEKMYDTVYTILQPKISDAAVLRRQYNPETDQVEDI